MLTKVKATLAKPENAYMKVSQKKKAFRPNRKDGNEPTKKKKVRKEESKK